MAKLKGSKNKNSSGIPNYIELSTTDRIYVLANLIIDQIIVDQQNGKKLLRNILLDTMT